MKWKSMEDSSTQQSLLVPRASKSRMLGFEQYRNEEEDKQIQRDFILSSDAANQHKNSSQ